MGSSIVRTEEFKSLQLNLQTLNWFILILWACRLPLHLVVKVFSENQKDVEPITTWWGQGDSVKVDASLTNRMKAIGEVFKITKNIMHKITPWRP